MYPMTKSENIITKISSNIFFKEFTFDKNSFCVEGDSKELADHILWLDNLLFLIQVKERNVDDIKSEKEENEWFQNKVIKKAKNQINDSVNFLKKHTKINIKNIRNHTFSISSSNLDEINKIIIYMPNSSLISDKNKSIKFYESKVSGNIHIFNIETYYWVCRLLTTPTELDEYLKFRERIYLKHKEIIQLYPEQYILAHFVNTPDESIIQENYIDTLSKLENDIADYDMSNMLNAFPKKIHPGNKKESTDYYLIIREIAKLKRYELKNFKERFTKIIKNASESEFYLPDRFTNLRTGCGFVFVSLTSDIDKQTDLLNNFVKIYAYKRKLNKCLGVSVSKTGDYFDVCWSFSNTEWSYDEELEIHLQKEEESGFYGNGKIKQTHRYKFNK